MSSVPSGKVVLSSIANCVFKFRNQKLPAHVITAKPLSARTHLAETEDDDVDYARRGERSALGQVEKQHRDGIPRPTHRMQQFVGIPQQYSLSNKFIQTDHTYEAHL